MEVVLSMLEDKHEVDIQLDMVCDCALSAIHKAGWGVFGKMGAQYQMKYVRDKAKKVLGEDPDFDNI